MPLQDPKRHPFQIIAGDQTVHDSVMPAFDAVVKPVFSVAVGVNDLFRFVFLRQGGKVAVSFHHVGGRIMQEHDETVIPVIPGGFEGGSQPLRFPFD